MLCLSQCLSSAHRVIQVVTDRETAERWSIDSFPLISDFHCSPIWVRMQTFLIDQCCFSIHFFQALWPLTSSSQIILTLYLSGASPQIWWIANFLTWDPIFYILESFAVFLMCHVLNFPKFYQVSSIWLEIWSRHINIGKPSPFAMNQVLVKLVLAQCFACSKCQPQTCTSLGSVRLFGLLSWTLFF